MMPGWRPRSMLVSFRNLDLKHHSMSSRFKIWSVHVMSNSRFGWRAWLSLMVTSVVMNPRYVSMLFTNQQTWPKRISILSFAALPWSHLPNGQTQSRSTYFRFWQGCAHRCKGSRGPVRCIQQHLSGLDRI